MRVLLADLVKQYVEMRDEVDSAIQSVLMSGHFILGPVVKQLECDIAEYSNARFAVGVNSGTDALLLALVCEEVGRGDEVITSPFTFVATVEAIVQVGAKPVFADIDPATFNLCPDHVESLINDRTRAIMPVDLFGQMADRDRFVAIAEKHNLHMVWDGAQAIGASFHGRKLGDFPGATTLSFFPTKNLGACGDAGMILTNDEAVRDRLMQYRFHGMDKSYMYERAGYCTRLDAMQAAILDIKLRHLEEWNRIRREHAAMYLELLANTRCVLPLTHPLADNVYHQFTVRHPNREGLRSFLKENGIDSGIYYPLSLHLQQAYRNLGYLEGAFPYAEKASHEVLSLPVHAQLSREQIEYVAEKVQEFDQL